MKLKILNMEGKEVGQTELPVQFLEPVREDLIKKAVLAIQNNERQAYGAFEDAGMRHAAALSKRRRKYRGSYGHGISRVPRKILSRRGTQMFWVGAIVPGTVGGRKAHPPKPEKEWSWKLNAKEKKKAIRSAMNAVMDKELVVKRGHKVPDSYPFALDEGLEKVSKTKELIKSLQTIGFKDELLRTGKTNVRSGKGKLRGRRKTSKKSLLLVVSDTKAVRKAATNVSGVDVVNVKRLNTELLAPGANPGRATIFTTKALDLLKTGLFMKDYKGESKKKVKEKKVKKQKKKKVETKPEVKKEVKKEPAKEVKKGNPEAKK